MITLVHHSSYSEWSGGLVRAIAFIFPSQFPKSSPKVTKTR
ncbi:MAG: hypothetical protein RMX68_009860 [Aulosira sp. ZfuVER01]|nr:hypothetical protein [Aulosira sp. ZfuVER01]MDZ7998023.1 hypothetical protein [Aulosira sp. DedVER01a]MDZ8050417.1 hypothetical protein [Aulosira sp. ZfuCHP01]